MKVSTNKRLNGQTERVLLQLKMPHPSERQRDFKLFFSIFSIVNRDIPLGLQLFSTKLNHLESSFPLSTKQN